ncbi:hypothetical protein F2Q69_00043833 [Brassica cretica]|uniref:Uncharacterized protein n=1 Tax=Brassica cretica TaxID=69181 RepID=A0A8S9NQC1_BRACR|nr:hypothetical protein F2Q69_00043833 [Brassica cretica]
MIPVKVESISSWTEELVTATRLRNREVSYREVIKLNFGPYLFSADVSNSACYIYPLRKNTSTSLPMATLISISPKQKCRSSASSKTLEMVRGLRLVSPQIKPISSGKTLTK